MHDYFCHIETYNHNHRIAVMVEFDAADDFALRTDEFRRFAHQIAIHIAAMAPASVDDLLTQNDVHSPERVGWGERSEPHHRSLKTHITHSVNAGRRIY
jgi:translation elongation factor EF-Ts